MNALLATPDVANLVGTRIYVRRGAWGGLSRELTPEAYSGDDELLPSIVVTLEARTTAPGRGGFGPDALVATQTIALWCYAQSGYDVIDQMVRAAKRRLNRARDLEPVSDPVHWIETTWAADTGDVVDPVLDVPLVASRYSAMTIDPLT